MVTYCIYLLWRCWMQTFLKKVTSTICRDTFIPTVDRYSKTMRLVTGALLGSIAVIFQSTGIFTGIGFVLSMMSTGPLVISSLLSIRMGVLTYIVTGFLLAILQPSELLIFLFTTGLLGLSLGIGLKYLRKNIFIISFAALCLTLGIAILLYGFKFAVWGPSVTTQFNGMVIGGTFVFSLLYSWIWKKLSISAFKIFNKMVSR